MGIASLGVHPVPKRWLSLPLPSTKLSLEMVCPSPVIPERCSRGGAALQEGDSGKELGAWGPAPK